MDNSIKSKNVPYSIGTLDVLTKESIKNLEKKLAHAQMKVVTEKFRMGCWIALEKPGILLDRWLSTENHLYNGISIGTFLTVLGIVLITTAKGPSEEFFIISGATSTVLGGGMLLSIIGAYILGSIQEHRIENGTDPETRLILAKKNLNTINKAIKIKMDPEEQILLLFNV